MEINPRSEAESPKSFLGDPYQLLKKAMGRRLTPDEEIGLDIAQIPPAMRQGYLIARVANSPDEISEKIEAGIRVDRSGDISFTDEFARAVIAMRFIGHKEDVSNRRVCEAVRRSLHYQNPALFRRASWESERTVVALKQADRALVSAGCTGTQTLVDCYTMTYGEQTHEQIKSASVFPKAAHLDQQTKIAEGKEKLDVSTILAHAAGASPRALAKMADFLIETYGQSDLLKPVIEDALKRICANLVYPARIAAFASSLDAAPFELSRKIPCEQAARELMSKPENVWEFFAWWSVNNAGGSKISAEIKKTAVVDVPARQKERIAQAFIDESDLILCAGVFEKLPEEARVCIADMLLDFRDVLDNPPLAAKLATVMRTDADLGKQRLAEYAVNHPSAAGKTEMDAFLSKIKAFMKRAGFTDESCAEVQSQIAKLSAGKAAKKGAAPGRAQRIAAHIKARANAAVNGAVPEEAEAGKLSREDFEKALRASISALELPADFGIRTANISGQKNILMSEVASIIADNDLMEVVFEKDPEKKVDTEQGSFISRLGISAVRFKRENGEVKVEFDLRRDEKEPGKYDGAIIKKGGKISFPVLPHDIPGLAEATDVEILRLFYKAANEGRDRRGCEPEILLMVLGLMEYVFESSPPEVPAKPADAEATPRELTPLERTKKFLEENYAAFELFMRGVGISVPGRFEDIVQIFTQLQYSIRINKAIPPGGIRVLPPPAHVFGNHVPAIDFYNVQETREIFRQIKIDPRMFHGAEDHTSSDGKVDAYFGRVHLNFGDPKEILELNVCIFPPNFDVYIIGVDTASLLTGGDNAQVAFIHMILASFRMAVMRNEDPENTRPDIPKGNPRPDAVSVQISKAVRDITKAQFPTIVVEWKPSAAPDKSIQDADNISHRLAAGRRALVTGKFEDIFTASGEMPAVLASHGTFLLARDYIRLIPNGADIFPPEAFADSSKRELREEYATVYVPLDETSKVSHVLNALREQKFAREPDRTLVDNVLQRAKSLDPSVTEQDVYAAFEQMCPVNPNKIFLATSGAADYRLPYKFRTNTREKPRENVFGNADFDVPPSASRDVVTIVAGNRAAISAVSDAWLRGDNRSSVMDFSASIQNPYRRRNSGSEISLRPRARALLVWEFMDGTHAFTYLDAARDSVDPATLSTVVPAPVKLQNFPRVADAVRRTISENISRTHTDFSDVSKWSSAELLRLERDGVLGLAKSPGGRVAGIAWSKPIKRKKIAIIKDESVGYRQFQLEPTTFAEYQKWAHENGNDIGIPYNPKIAMIQNHFYELLGM